jgi:hypothetical protein
MGFDLLTILKLCGIAGLLFSFGGFSMLFVAVRMARREFRVKGFLRPPAGAAWIRFLFWKQYEYFENPNTRLLFGATHFCMIGAILVLACVAALIGSELLYGGMDGLTFTSAPSNIPLDQP